MTPAEGASVIAQHPCAPPPVWVKQPPPLSQPLAVASASQQQTSVGAPSMSSQAKSNCICAQSPVSSNSAVTPQRKRRWRNALMKGILWQDDYRCNPESLPMLDESEWRRLKKIVCPKFSLAI